MSELSDKQKQFTRDVVQLLQFAWEMGYEIAFGEALRSDEQAAINSIGQEGRERVAQLLDGEFPELSKRIRNNGKNNGILLSIHQDKLAIDLALFKNGVYLTETEDYRLLGEHWLSIAADNRWGGHFRDGNHFSKEYQGRK